MQTGAGEIPGSYPPAVLDVATGQWTLKTKGLIKIESLSHSMELPILKSNVFSHTIGITSEVEQHNLQIRRLTDGSSIGLLNAFLSRTVMSSLQIICGVMAKTAVTSSPLIPGSPDPDAATLQPQWILRVAPAVISEFSYESSESGGFAEDISIHYVSIAWIYRQVDDGGALGTPNVVGLVNHTNVVTVIDEQDAHGNTNPLHDSGFTPTSLDDYFNEEKYT